jgi:hypothetical protein
MSTKDSPASHRATASWRWGASRLRLAGFDKLVAQSLSLVLSPKPAVAVAQTQPLRCSVSHSADESLVLYPNCGRPLHVAEPVEGTEGIANADVIDGEYIRIEDGEDRRGSRESKTPLGQKYSKSLFRARCRMEICGDLAYRRVEASGYPSEPRAVPRPLSAEIKGGGIKRLEELLPRHPRDNDAWKSLGEIFRVCHEQILSLVAPRLHLRMAAISLKWMRGDPLPEIIDVDHKYNGGALSSSIRKTLNDTDILLRRSPNSCVRY